MSVHMYETAYLSYQLANGASLNGYIRSPVLYFRFAHRYVYDASPSRMHQTINRESPIKYLAPSSGLWVKYNWRLANPISITDRCSFSNSYVTTPEPIIIKQHYICIRTARSVRVITRGGGGVIIISVNATPWTYIINYAYSIIISVNATPWTYIINYAYSMID